MLVDTSVWIDFFAGRESWQVHHLQQLLLDGEDLHLCGIVVTEVLQGIRSDKQYQSVKQHLSPLLMLPMDESVFILAADLFRQLRKKGQTIRKTNDCIIAATAITQGVALLHHDRDFEALARYSELETIQL